MNLGRYEQGPGGSLRKSSNNGRDTRNNDLPAPPEGPLDLEVNVRKNYPDDGASRGSSPVSQVTTASVSTATHKRSRSGLDPPARTSLAPDAPPTTELAADGAGRPVNRVEPQELHNTDSGMATTTGQRQDFALYGNEDEDEGDVEDKEEPSILSAAFPPVLVSAAKQPPASNQQQQLSSPAALPSRSMRASTLPTTLSSKKQGDLIVLGGTYLKKSRTFDSNSSPGIAPSPSYEIRETASDLSTPSSCRGSSCGATLPPAINPSYDSQESKRVRVSSRMGGAAAAVGVASAAVAVAAVSSRKQVAAVPSPGGQSSAFDSIAFGDHEEYDAEVATSPTSPATMTPAAHDIPKTKASNGSVFYGSKRLASDDDDAELAQEGTPADELPQMVNHNFNSQPKAGARSIFGMSRVAFGIASLCAAGAAGLGVWTGVKVPELNSQVADLEDQVNRLTVQVDRLEVENERFEASNNALNSSIQLFQDENEKLNETSHQLAKDVVRLNISITLLETQVVVLENITREISDVNDDINATNQALHEDLMSLNASVIGLTDANGELNQTIDEINSNITRLETENDKLKATEQNLTRILGNLTDINEDLRQSLQDLENVTIFLNKTVNNTVETLRGKIEALSADIDVNRALGIEQLHLSYLDSFYNWDCRIGLPHLFQNPDVNINSSNLNEVLNYQASALGLVRQICLNNTNYQEYLDYTHSFSRFQMSTTELVQGTNDYSLAALKYMFPNFPKLEGGMTAEEWELANYTCQHIPQYRWQVGDDISRPGSRQARHFVWRQLKEIEAQLSNF